MRSTELRIGNLIDLYGKQVRVIGIDKTLHGDYHVTYNDGEKDYRTARYLDQFEPIPLTEEWLVRFGFKAKSKHHGLYLDGIWFVDISPLKSGSYCFGELMQGTYCEIQYVHSLQNLYFCLTGKELEYEANRQI